MVEETALSETDVHEHLEEAARMRRGGKKGASSWGSGMKKKLFGGSKVGSGVGEI